MKRGTPHHRKMHELAKALKIPLPMAVGIMEMLWQFAGQYTQQGDIGRVPDRVIAGAADWQKKPETLINAMVQTGWLDRVDEPHRLIIHDWPEHCEQSVIKWLEYNDKKFLPIYGVSLDNRKRNSSKSLPSREAKAEAKDSESEVPEKKTPEVSLPAGYAFDEQYQQFREACKSWGMNVIDPEDFVSAWFEWSSLDGLQRADAVSGIMARREAGNDPAYAKSPKNYLKNREWKRAVRSPKKSGLSAEDIAAL